jgi:hypothetical protein
MAAISTRSTPRAQPQVNARTAGVYLRAAPEEMSVMDGPDHRQRSDLIAERLRHWEGVRSA